MLNFNTEEYWVKQGMCPEWAKQQALCLIWPTIGSDWGPFLPEIEQTYFRIVEAVCPFQPVLLICPDAEKSGELNASLAHPNCQVINIPSNQTWFRDFSPITKYDGEQLIHCLFEFNGWGEKYPYDLDKQLSQSLHEQGLLGERQIESIDLNIEGGNCESDGAGTVMVSESCLTHHRNQGLTADEVAHQLMQTLSAQQILRVENAHLQGDDTDGHIDNLARFVDKNTLLYCAQEEVNDTHYDAMQSLEKQVKQFRNADGQPYKTIPIPMPSPIFDEDNQQLPASYLNFVITNEVILLPVFNCETDAVVKRQFQTLFPHHQIKPIDSTMLVHQYGGLHCATAAIYEDISHDDKK